MTRRWGIRGRVLAIAVMPAALLSLLLGFFFTQSRIADLDEMLQDQGRAIVRHLASASEYGVFAGNTALLRGLAEATSRESEVNGVAIYDTAGQHPLVSAGSFTNPPLPLPASPTAAEAWAPSVARTDDTLLIRGPILLGGVAIDDFAERAGASSAGRQDLLGWVRVELDRRETVRRQGLAMRHGMLIVVLGLIASGLLAWRMGKNVSDPILQLTDGIKHLKSGSLGHRVQLKADGELGSLAAGINAMARELESRQQDLEARIDLATRALQERNVQLEQAQQAALAASDAKSAFLANMSHEIRTPIGVVIGFADHLLKTDLSREQHEFAEKIRLSASSLLAIINDVLDFSKIEAGKLTLSEAPFNLEECLEEVVTMLAPAAHQKGLELAVLVYEDVPRRIFGDVGRLRQVLINLVANAIKFTEHGSVDVLVETADAESHIPGLTISVRDTGIGMEEEDRRRLFSAFTQVGYSAGRSAGGTGLGLAIARQLVFLMGGTMHEVQSRPGGGSTFALSVPCGTQCQAETQVGDGGLLTGVNAIVWEPAPLPRLALCSILESLGAEVTVPEAAPTPLSLPPQRTGRQQLLFLALARAELAAPEGAATVRALSARLPVIVLASVTEPHAWAHIIEQGASLFLPKPVLRRQLVPRLRDIIAPSEAPHRSERATESATNCDADLLQGKRVLLADDNRTSARVVELMLRHLGAEVIIAVDGLAALQAFRNNEFDLVLMDMQMPVMNGVDAIRQIRALDPAAAVPVIGLTAFATNWERECVLAAGADACLLKPLREPELHGTIADLLSPPAPRSTGREAEAAATANGTATLAPTGSRDNLWAQFLAELPAQRDAINEAYRSGDFEEMRQQVHRAHGPMCYCEAETLRRATAALERELQQGGAVAELLAHFNVEVERVLPAACQASEKP